jgi:transcription factor SFP1
MQQQNAFSPETSLPGTPSELDGDYSDLAVDMSMPANSQFLQSNFGYEFGGGNDMLDLCIDEPAKRLFSPNGGFNNQQYAQFRMQGGQLGGGSELARRIREQQLMAGMAGAGAGLLPGEEIKPFRCPVIGCEKAYKNQNGLKYHKTVSFGMFSRLSFICGG